MLLLPKARLVKRFLPTLATSPFWPTKVRLLLFDLRTGNSNVHCRPLHDYWCARYVAHFFNSIPQLWIPIFFWSIRVSISYYDSLRASLIVYIGLVAWTHPIHTHGQLKCSISLMVPFVLVCFKRMEQDLSITKCRATRHKSSLRFTPFPLNL